jgi:hypothetical protein
MNNSKSPAIIDKIILWLKKTENMVLIILLFVVTIIGIIDGNLDIIAMVYAFAFLFGLLIGVMFYLKNRFL